MRIATEAATTARAALRPMSDETDGETDENSRNRFATLPSLSRSGPKRSWSAVSSSSRSDGSAGPKGGASLAPSMRSVRTSRRPPALFWLRGAAGRVAELRQGRPQRVLAHRLGEAQRERRAAGELDALAQAVRQEQRHQPRQDEQHREDVEPEALADEIDHGSAPSWVPPRAAAGRRPAAGAAPRAAATSLPKSQRWRITVVPTRACRKVRVTVIAENMLTRTPSASVSAKPFTSEAPNW